MEDESVEKLIDLYEDRLCLWDVFSDEYSKRNLRDRAMKEISDVMDISVAYIRSKLNGLRAQLRREIAAVNKVKSGQGADEKYNSSWVFYLFVCISSSKLSSMAIAATTFMTVSFGSMLRMNFVFECCMFMLDEACKCDFILYNKFRECWMLDVGFVWARL